MVANELAKELGISVESMYEYCRYFRDFGHVFEKAMGGHNIYTLKELEMFKKFLEFLRKGHATAQAIRMSVKGCDPDVDKVYSVTEIAKDLSMKSPNVVRHIKYLEDLGYIVRKYENGRYMLTEGDRNALNHMLELHKRGYPYKKCARIVVGVERALAFTEEELVKHTKFDLQTVRTCLSYVEEDWCTESYRCNNGFHIFSEERFKLFQRLLGGVNRL